MALVLSGLQWQTLLVYLDDIIVVSNSFSQHLERLEDVLVRFRQYELKLKPKKCHTFKRSVTFLGHIVNGEGIQVNPELTDSVRKWERPNNVRELQSFLGLCNYYRRFVARYSHIA